MDHHQDNNLGSDIVHGVSSAATGLGAIATGVGYGVGAVSAVPVVVFVGQVATVISVVFVVRNMIQNIYEFFVDDEELYNLLKNIHLLLDQYLEKLFMVQYIYTLIPEKILEKYIDKNMVEIIDLIKERHNKLLSYIFALAENRDGFFGWFKRFWNRFVILEEIENDLAKQTTYLSSFYLAFYVQNTDIFDKLSSIGHKGFFLKKDYWNSTIARYYLMHEPLDSEFKLQLEEKEKKIIEGLNENKDKIFKNLSNVIQLEKETDLKLEKMQEEIIEKKEGKEEIIQGEITLTGEAAINNDEKEIKILENKQENSEKELNKIMSSILDKAMEPKSTSPTISELREKRVKFFEEPKGGRASIKLSIRKTKHNTKKKYIKKTANKKLKKYKKSRKHKGLH